MKMIREYPELIKNKSEEDVDNLSISVSSSEIPNSTEQKIRKNPNQKLN